MGSRTQALYVAYFCSDFTGIEARMSEIVGNNPDVIIVDSMTLLNTGRRGKSRMAHDLLMSMNMVQAVPEEYRPRDYEPLPKPPQAKLRINQAPKQSFRQSMRSVNRNR